MRIGERFRSQLFWCNSETFGFKSIWRHFYQRKLFSISQSVCDNDDRCLQKKKWQEEATLYVHWPYCERRCTYCNFNKYISNSVDHKRMEKCLVQELKYLIKLSEVATIKSVFFGGGTPSLADPEIIESIIQTAREMTFLPGDAEVTIEVNPTSLEAEKLRAFKEAGINRVSLGLQALSSSALKLFGRNHSVAEGLKCLEISKQLFPGKTSVDVIFGRPGQTTEEWEKELKQVVELADNHISLYQLTLERGTALFKMVMDRQVMMPSAETMADLYELAVKMLNNSGFHRYEASNFARSKWPYCERRCTYCNFNKYISNSVDHKRMEKCLVQELKYLIKLSEVATIKSVFFGGGTPSLADPEIIESIIQTAREMTFLPGDAEVTIEVNPTSLEAEKLRAFKEAGINRVSLGLQALSSSALKLFGRNHSVAEGLKCLEISKQLFPGKTSVDVIFGRPGQTTEEWEKELKQVVELADNHISLYQLTLERGTALFKMVMDRQVMMPSAETMADLYELAVKMLNNSGFHRYEASNFARSKEAESTHNKHYWTGTQYIGIGPGAHARFVPFGEDCSERQWRVQTLEPDPWMFEVEKYGHGTRKAQPQNQLAVLEELLATGLRTTEGITSETWAKFYGKKSLEEIFSDMYIVRTLIQEKFLFLDKRGLKTSEKGLNVVDSIIPELIHGLNTYWEIERSF